MKNKIIRTFTVTLAAVLCLTAFSTTAFAGGTDPDPADDPGDRHRRRGHQGCKEDEPEPRLPGINPGERYAAVTKEQHPEPEP